MKADLILTADLHLTTNTPISRTDDYIKAQERKLNFLQELSEKNNHCPILCSGDIFDHWKASPELCSWAYTNLPSKMIVIPGNHDLPMHSMEHYKKSALYLLEITKKLTVLKENTFTFINIFEFEVTGIPFGELDKLKLKPRIKRQKRILMLHELVWPGKKPPWVKNSYSSHEIIKKFGKYYDLIITGDNHKNFTLKYKDTILVNPGSMLRRTIDQVDFEPKCYLYYSSKNEVEEVKFPIEKEVHNQEYTKCKEEKDKRINAYIERINDNWESGLSFEDNLRAFFEKNNTSRKVREIIWQAMEK